MPRGGARAISGPMKGFKQAKAKKLSALPADIRQAARESGVSPLDYMLAVMNDVTTEDARRDRMAVAAAPYVHSRAIDMAPGKKEQANIAAGTAHEDSDWDGLVQ